MTKYEVKMLFYKICPYLILLEGFNTVHAYYGKQKILLFDEEQIRFPYHIALSQSGEIFSYDKYLKEFNGFNCVSFKKYTMSDKENIEKEIILLNSKFKKCFAELKELKVKEDFE